MLSIVVLQQLGLIPRRDDDRHQRPADEAESRRVAAGSAVREQRVHASRTLAPRQRILDRAPFVAGGSVMRQDRVARNPAGPDMAQDLGTRIDASPARWPAASRSYGCPLPSPVGVPGAVDQTAAQPP
jgi:hypothetical protein